VVYVNLDADVNVPRVQLDGLRRGRAGLTTVQEVARMTSQS
jgi:hypothetical protein